MDGPHMNKPQPLLWRLSCGLLLLMALIGSPVSSARADAISDAETGIGLAHQGDYANALVALQRAFDTGELLPPLVRFRLQAELAGVLVRQGQIERAERLLAGLFTTYDDLLASTPQDVRGPLLASHMEAKIFDAFVAANRGEEDRAAAIKEEVEAAAAGYNRPFILNPRDLSYQLPESDLTFPFFAGALQRATAAPSFAPGAAYNVTYLGQSEGQLVLVTLDLLPANSKPPEVGMLEVLLQFALMDPPGQPLDRPQPAPVSGSDALHQFSAAVLRPAHGDVPDLIHDLTFYQVGDRVLQAHASYSPTVGTAAKEVYRSLLEAVFASF